MQIADFFGREENRICFFRPDGARHVVFNRLSPGSRLGLPSDARFAGLRYGPEARVNNEKSAVWIRISCASLHGKSRDVDSELVTQTNR
jgi:hypothetical protein